MTPAPRVLLIDDNPDIVTAISVLLTRHGMACQAATNPADGLRRLAAEPYDVVLLDLNFQRGATTGDEGLACLERIRQDDPEAAVVVITGHSGLSVAVRAMRMGASEFLMKPWSNQALLQAVQSALDNRRAAPSVTETAGTGNVHRLLGESVAAERLRTMLRRVAPTRANVLIHGPAGVGKRSIAEAIHRASSSAVRDLTSMEADMLLEAASLNNLVRDGAASWMVLSADHLSYAQQGRLYLRVAAQAFPRLFAIVRDVGALREDLRAALGEVEIAVPSLAERQADILDYARFFVLQAARRFGRNPPRLTIEAEALLMEHEWADNLRGLRRVIDHAVLQADTTIDVEALSLAGPSQLGDEVVRLDLASAERTLVEAALRRHGFNVSRAARDLGLTRGALYRRMAKYAL